MKAHVEVLTATSSDTPGTTIILHLDSKRYVFGQFSEGSQRAFMERRVRLSKISDLFVTGPTEWKNTGGLVGLLLAMGDLDGKRTSSSAVDAKMRQLAGLRVHGGDNLRYTLATMRRFVFRTGMELNVHEIEEGVDFRDENIVVRTLHVRRQPECASGKLVVPSLKEAQSKIEDKRLFFEGVVRDMFCSSWSMDTMIDEDSLVVSDAGVYRSMEHTEHNPQLSTRLPPKGKTRAPWPASMIENLPSTTPSPIALSYFVQLHEQRGKFLPDLARRLG
jgi:ribonuclease Z